MSKHAITFDHSKNQTKQSFKDECDINKIMAKFQRTGAINHYAKHSATYGEITETTLSDAVNLVADAETMFEELPSKIRKKFNNDPGQFLTFVQEPKNLDEMRELGLAKKTSHVKPTAPSQTINEHAPAQTGSTVEDVPKGE